MTNFYDSPNTDWSFIKRKVNELFRDGKVKEVQLQEFSNCFIQLARRHENVLSIEYKEMLMPGGMKILLDKINKQKQKSGSDFDLLFYLGEVWVELRCQILPTLQLIFSPIKHTQTSLERITLSVFRDEVVLKTDIVIVLKELARHDGDMYLKEVPKSVIQMLLILGNLSNKDSSSQQQKICELCSLVVKPYINPFHKVTSRTT